MHEDGYPETRRPVWMHHRFIIFTCSIMNQGLLRLYERVSSTTVQLCSAGTMDPNPTYRLTQDLVGGMPSHNIARMVISLILV